MTSTNTLIIDDGEERLRLEYEDGELIEYYRYHRSDNQVYSLNPSTLKFLKFVKPEEDEQKISYEENDEVVVYGIDVWTDVVEDCLTKHRLTNAKIVEMLKEHPDSEKKKRSEVGATKA